MKLYVKLLFLVGGWWVGQKKTKLMLYSTLVEIEVEVGVELGKKKEKTNENSGHYVIASSRPPERRPLERRTLAPIVFSGIS